MTLSQPAGGKNPTKPNVCGLLQQESPHIWHKWHPKSPVLSIIRSKSQDIKDTAPLSPTGLLPQKAPQEDKESKQINVICRNKQKRVT